MFYYLKSQYKIEFLENVLGYPKPDGPTFVTNMSDGIEI